MQGVWERHDAGGHIAPTIGQTQTHTQAGSAVWVDVLQRSLRARAALSQPSTNSILIDVGEQRGRVPCARRARRPFRQAAALEQQPSHGEVGDLAEHSKATATRWTNQTSTSKGRSFRDSDKKRRRVLRYGRSAPSRPVWEARRERDP